MSPGKRRKAEGGFPGSDIILQQIKDKPKVRRVGFTSKGAPARGIEQFRSLIVYIYRMSCHLI